MKHHAQSCKRFFMSKFFSARGPRVLRLLVVGLSICCLATMWSLTRKKTPHHTNVADPGPEKLREGEKKQGEILAVQPPDVEYEKVDKTETKPDLIANEVAEALEDKKNEDKLANDPAHEKEPVEDKVVEDKKPTEDKVIEKAPTKVDLNQAVVEEKAAPAKDEGATNMALDSKAPSETTAKDSAAAEKVEVAAKDVASEANVASPVEAKAPDVAEEKPVGDANDVALDEVAIKLKEKSQKKKKHEPTIDEHQAADASNTDRYNVHSLDLPKTNKSKKGEGKGRWDLTNLQTEIVDLGGHKVILHHGSHFKMLDKYPITDDPYNYVLEDTTQTKLCTQAERAEFLQDKCRERGYKRWDELSDAVLEKTKLPNLLVDDTHKVMFCQSLKKSSTNKWIKFFGIATGRVTDLTKVPIHHMEEIGLKGLNEYSIPERRERLKTYTKFIIVRHAYRRISNIWDDDFRVEGTATRWRLGPKLIEMFHGNGSYTHGDMLSYTDYVKYILSDKADGYYGVTMMDACSPCMVDYNFIRRIETGPLDSEDILKKLGIYDNEVIRDAEKHHGLRSLTTSVHAMRELSQELKDQLYERFKDDIELFGYTQKDGRAGCAIQRKDGSTCC